MAQSVVVKKEEKIEAVFNAMVKIDDLNEFKAKFKEFYPNDWTRINEVFQREEALDKKKKGHPMPNPEKYLENMFKVALKKRVNN